MGFTLSTPFNGRTLYLSPSLFSSPLCLPSSFHLYSLHDDTPAMLSWQQSGPDCLVARQLTSPIRGTWRYKARDKQVTQNMCACTLLCWVLESLYFHGFIGLCCVTRHNFHFIFSFVDTQVEIKMYFSKRGKKQIMEMWISVGCLSETAQQEVKPFQSVTFRWDHWRSVTSDSSWITDTAFQTNVSY